jgi:hypothetical protein
MPSSGVRQHHVSAGIDAGCRSAYHGCMKHVPEAHQRVAPDRTIALILTGIVLVMAIILVVVALAD